MGDAYTHGHHASVLRSHRWRTAENSAAYLLGSLAPGQRLLDLGCELEAMAAAWRRWAAAPDATYIVVHGEVLARR